MEFLIASDVIYTIAVERGLDKDLVLAGLDLLLEPVSLGPPAISTSVGIQSNEANSE